jgi:hypothetical protein
MEFPTFDGNGQIIETFRLKKKDLNINTEF